MKLANEITITTLLKCVSKKLDRNDVHIKSWGIEPITCESINFTTGGIYRVHGIAVSNTKEIPWSLVLKIIQPQSPEKDHPQHHNYWKREALVNQSGILADLPKVIHTPQCYLVEEKADGTVWIWMEEVQEDNSSWTANEFEFVARQLGNFNSVYVAGRTIPDEPWVCRNWLASWINGCKQYASDPNVHYPLIQGNDEIDSIWNSFTSLNENIEQHLQVLNKLPRVLAHQDLSRQNMYIHMNKGTERRLTLIDWQFLSISGLGEDLGKLFGVALSQGNIPSEQGDYYHELLLMSYIEGLRDIGWNGNDVLPKYGFYISFALRSVWEVPRLFKLLVDSQMDEQSGQISNIEKLTRIVRLQMKLGDEAQNILHKLLMGKAI